MITVSGWDQVSQAGHPQLPLKTVMIGAPLSADIQLEVLDVEYRALGAYRIPPAPQPIVEWKLGDLPNGVAFLPRYTGQKWEPDPAIYARDAFYPDRLAEVIADGLLRHQRVATIALTPFQYHPASGQVRVAERFIVRVTFSSLQRSSQTIAFSEAEPGGFEQLLQSSLLNYQDARNWRGGGMEKTSVQTWIPPVPGYKILVTQDGMYQLTRADLAAAGIPVEDLDPRSIQIFSQGQELAIYVQGEQDGKLDTDDYILFYGLVPRSKYNEHNVYWLTYGAQTGRRMTERDGTPTGSASVPGTFQASRHFEQGGFYYSNAVGDDDLDRWLWDDVFAPSIPSLTFTLDLPHLPVGTYTATLEIALYGGIAHSINPDHHVQLYMNEHLIDDDWWDGRVWHIRRVDFPQTYLQEGVNTLRVHCPNDTGVGYDRVLIDWFALDYWSLYTAEDDRLWFDQDSAGTWEFHVTGFSAPNVQIFDVTEPASVTRIVSATVETKVMTHTLKFQDAVTETQRYLALTSNAYLSPETITLDNASDWWSPSHGADYIVITHADFYTEALRLADHRAGQGLRTVVVDVEDIFDEFSFGLVEPSAIRDLIAYAYENWVPPAPAYVLLVGDGLYDFKNHSGSGMKNYVPPYLAVVDPWLGETSTDNRYVCVSGADILPDLHIGRLPVNTTSEAAAAVTKILAYETLPLGAWNQTLTFVADNPDTAGNFYALSDDLVNNYLPAPYTATKVYLGQTCPQANPATECRQRLINSINVTGTLVVNYIGHASIISWAAERLFSVSNIPALTNSEKLPIFLPMTCYDGYYIYPRPDIPCMGESVVRADGKGAVASWSPAGLGVAFGHHHLNKGFFQSVFFDDVPELGAATLTGKLRVYNSGADYDLIETYHLFGDPALRVHTLGADLGIEKRVSPTTPLLPGDRITYTLAFSNTGPATAHHIVISDTLPGPLLNPIVVSAGITVTPRAGARFVWDVADLAAGQGGAITITATISPTFAGVFANTAIIATTAVETNTTNNVAGPVLTSVNIPDLVIDKHGPTEVMVGSVITYSLVYTNVGTAPASQVVISDVLPAELFSVSVASAGAAISPRAGANFVWDVVDLGPGAGGRITITAALNPAFYGTLTNTAVITATTPEATPSNNADTLVTRIRQYAVYLPIVLRN